MPAQPAEIEKRGAEAVRVVWADGHVSDYPNPELRLACACAVCVDEWTGERRVQRRDIGPDIHPTGLSLVGNYALQIDWSDGHSTGIYTFEHLRRVCPCPACSG
jgi:DUF971 family protein